MLGRQGLERLWCQTFLYRVGPHEERYGLFVFTAHDWQRCVAGVFAEAIAALRSMLGHASSSSAMSAQPKSPTLSPLQALASRTQAHRYCARLWQAFGQAQSTRVSANHNGSTPVASTLVKEAPAELGILRMGSEGCSGKRIAYRTSLTWGQSTWRSEHINAVIW